MSSACSLSELCLLSVSHLLCGVASALQSLEVSWTSRTAWTHSSYYITALLRLMMMVVSALRHTTKTSSPVVELRKKQWGERRATPRRRKRRDFDAVYCMGSTTAVGGIPRPTGNSSMVITVRTAAATDSYRERTIDRRTDGRTDRQTGAI